MKRLNTVRSLLKVAHACLDEYDLEVLPPLLSAAEYLLKTDPPHYPTSCISRRREELVAAHVRAWHQRHPQQGDASC